MLLHVHTVCTYVYRTNAQKNKFVALILTKCLVLLLLCIIYKNLIPLFLNQNKKWYKVVDALIETENIQKYDA